MSRARLVHLVLVALGTAPIARAAESSLRCDGGIVQVGDAKLDLLGKCGAPALRDARPTSRGAVILEGGRVALESTAATSEEWTYNFGPRSFLMRVTLEGGKVVEIQRGGYGYDPALVHDSPVAGLPRCEASALQLGVAKLDLLARCGQPATSDVRQERREVRAEAGSGAVTGVRSVQVEVWTYDFGPRRFMSIVTLEDGTVVAVDRSGYGYAH